MKKWIVALLAVLCVGATTGLSQTFAGLSWEGQPGLVLGGNIIDVSDKVKTFGYARLSIDSAGYDNGLKTQQTLGAELTYHLIDKVNQDFYLIGGAGVDWANAGEERTLTTYITQSVGGMFTTRATFLDKIPLLNELLTDPGLWFAGKFRPQLFDTDTQWSDKFVVGFGIYSGI